jgi:hypothetical protein
MSPQPLRRALLAICAAAAALLGACRSTPEEPDPDWVSLEIQAGSEKVLWEFTVASIQKLGFPIGAEMDERASRALSGWKESLMPFKGMGHRERAEVRFEPVGERAAGRFRVEVRVKKQTNENLARPLDPTYAEWEWAADDREQAKILLQHIRSYFPAEVDVHPEAPRR